MTEEMKAKVAQWKAANEATFAGLRELGVEVNPEELTDEQIARKIAMSEGIAAALAEGASSVAERRARYQAMKAARRKAEEQSSDEL
ncbi:hypothetical protein [Deinococcus sp.]|uniref:hypothetical protein n=1 Tax=Deinococcus sp. TaxID=47478 RepID=UPI0025BA891D|nr:hypothetical protein [Deinococcus sp.]